MKNIQKNFFMALIFAGLIGLCLSVPAKAFNGRVPHMFSGGHQRICGQPENGAASCLAQVMVTKPGKAATFSLPAGYGPTQFHTAYQFPTTSTKPATIAIVDAYGDSNIGSDLATYDKTYGLPVFPTCSSSVTTSCFEKISQTGSTTRLPAINQDWALETSLDVEMAHQTCQNCKLILVEANNSTYTNLMTAEDEARTSGATVISNSYGSPEFSTETAYDTHFNYPGIAFIFSTGDDGYSAAYPAASPYVVAAGGTTLNLTSSNAWQSETTWSDTGSGCSAFEPRPVFQSDPACLNRTVADVSADANPSTGAAVYDSIGYGVSRGWFQVGGTSLAAPLIAGTYGLANNVGPTTYANSLPYANFNYAVNMHDITNGSNGSCAGTNLCQASIGYDGPSGLGSPNGLGAF